MVVLSFVFFFFFFNDTATTEIYTLSLHDALPISERDRGRLALGHAVKHEVAFDIGHATRSEEHTSELQSHVNLVCRLLLEKKNTKQKSIIAFTNKKGEENLR